MTEKFTFEEIAKLYPEAVDRGTGAIELSELIQHLVAEVNDLKDQMNEKDYQIMYLMKKIDGEA